MSGSDSEIKIWNFVTVNCLQTINVGHLNFVFSIIKISNDKIASGDEDGKIIVWNLNNGERLKTIDEHSNRIFSIANMLNNIIIISCSSYKTTKV